MDGGLYKHQQKDPMRIYMRSSDSHFLFAPLGLRASWQIQTGSMSRIKHWAREGGTSIAAAESGMFPGYRAERRLRYDRSDNSICIDDHVTPLMRPCRERETALRSRGQERAYGRKGGVNWRVHFGLPARHAEGRKSRDRWAARMGGAPVLACQSWERG